MSPRFAAPSTASISAWATTSPSEWPARPGSPGNSTPPRTSGFAPLKPCASTPIPTRRSDNGEDRRQLVQRLDPERGPFGASLQIAPGAAPDVHRHHPGRRGRHDVVVDPVAHVRDLSRLQVDLLE